MIKNEEKRKMKNMKKWKRWKRNHKENGKENDKKWRWKNMITNDKRNMINAMISKIIKKMKNILKISNV
jgi:hypothetical protein